MIYINTEGTEPTEFVTWKQVHKTNITDPSRTGVQLWKYLYRHGRVEKEKIRKSLIVAQGYVCCYCGKRINLTKGETRIDHVQPKSDDPINLTFDYYNLLLSCVGGEKQLTYKVSSTDSLQSIIDEFGATKDYLDEVNGGSVDITPNNTIVIFDGEPKTGYHCDKLKENDKIEIHPLQNDCFNKFEYIVGSDKKVTVNEKKGCLKTRKTINVTGLNSDVLKKVRYRIIDETNKLISSLITATDSIEDIIEKFSKIQLQLNKKDSQGYYEPFYFVGLEYLNTNGYKLIDTLP